jgi:ornithine carbamoyltransferase
MYLRWEDLQLARGETLADTAKTLSLYVQGIMARVFKHSDLEEMAKHSPVPVINGLSDLYHPCQTLADLLTILEKVGRVKGAKLAWVGDGNNVCNSLLIGCSILGINMMVACPPGYEPHKEAFEWAEKEARRTGCEISLVREPENAVKDADVVYTDTFVSMGMESEYEKRRSVFLPRYQVTPKLLSHAKKGAIFMHCLPAHRGEEVVSEVIDGPQSVVWEQASNRLYTTMGILSLLMHV